MKNEVFSSSVTTDEMYEYFLVAHPDNTVTEKLMAERRSFYDGFTENKGMEIQPDITIANFVANEAMEETIIRWMQRICSKEQSFTVTLTTYSGLPPHTIYLRVQNAQPFERLAKELKVIDTFVNSCSCPAMKIMSNPYVSIAWLAKENYSKALTQYAKKSFHESFVVNELQLLKRKDEYDKRKPVIIFSLQPGNNELFN